MEKKYPALTAKYVAQNPKKVISAVNIYFIYIATVYIRNARNMPMMRKSTKC